MHSHRTTDHVQVNTRLCEACGRCVEACRHEVLRMVRVLFHAHVKVSHADRCRGCLRCVRACRHGAIQALHPRPRREAKPAAGPSAAR